MSQPTRVRTFYINEEPFIDISLGHRPSGLLRPGQTVASAVWAVSGSGGPVLVGSSEAIVTTLIANDTARAKFTMPAIEGRWTITCMQTLQNPAEKLSDHVVVQVIPKPT